MFSFKKVILIAGLLSASLIQPGEQQQISGITDINASYIGLACLGGASLGTVACGLKALYHSRMAVNNPAGESLHKMQYANNVLRMKRFGLVALVSASFLAGRYSAFQQDLKLFNQLLPKEGNN